MKNSLKTLNQMYDRDSDSNAYIINVVVKKYEDIFNNLDPSPYKRRDLNSNLISFLEDCSLDIPLQFKTLLQFQVPKAIRNEDLEYRITLGLGNYFSYIMNSFSRRLKMIDDRSMAFVGISFALLLIATFMTRLDIDNLFSQTINEGIFIGGWVFLWEAISSYSIKKKEVKNEYRHYKRFCRSPINFCSYDSDAKSACSPVQDSSPAIRT